MAKKNQSKQSKLSAVENPKALHVAQQPTETPAEALTHTSLRPTVQAALTLLDYNQAFGELSVNTLVADLRAQCELASGGDLARSEALLVAQAHTLDAIFHKLARKATHCEYLNQLDTNLRLALKAQSQCRATLETLAVIKNPRPVAFVRQANIAHGPQQVNNSAGQPDSATRAGETKNRPNKLLEAHSEQGLDLGSADASGGSDSTLETVGAFDRSEDIKR